MSERDLYDMLPGALPSEPGSRWLNPIQIWTIGTVEFVKGTPQVTACAV